MQMLSLTNSPAVAGLEQEGVVIMLAVINIQNLVITTFIIMEILLVIRIVIMSGMARFMACLI